jgi:hypothetical protein
VRGPISACTAKSTKDCCSPIRRLRSKYSAVAVGGSSVGISMMVVTPPTAAAVVAERKSSRRRD